MTTDQRELLQWLATCIYLTASEKAAIRAALADLDAPICNSLVCTGNPGKHPHCPACSHAYYTGIALVTRRSGLSGLYRWTFNPQFGPNFTGPTGRAVKAPFPALWNAFKEWHAARFAKAFEGGKP